MAVTWLAEASRPRADATARDKTAAINPSSLCEKPHDQISIRSIIYEHRELGRILQNNQIVSFRFLYVFIYIYKINTFLYYEIID
jgi:hypothetical protein